MAKIRYKEIEVTVDRGSEWTEVGAKHPELALRFGCRQGECGTCARKILEGANNITRLTAAEQEVLKRLGYCEASYRLLCQCAVQGDVTLN